LVGREYSTSGDGLDEAARCDSTNSRRSAVFEVDTSVSPDSNGRGIVDGGILGRQPIPFERAVTEDRGQRPLRIELGDPTVLDRMDERKVNLVRLANGHRVSEAGESHAAVGREDPVGSDGMETDNRVVGEIERPIRCQGQENRYRQEGRRGGISRLYDVPPPAYVVMMPSGATLRMRPLPLSAMYSVPSGAKASPRGSLSCASIAGPWSPAAPAVPVPA